MKTKLQKANDMERAGQLLKDAKSLVFVDFSKTPTKELNILKTSLHEMESVYKVIKKRLLGLVFKEKNIGVDVNEFNSQLGTIFSQKDIVDTAGTVYRFAKEKEKILTDFKLLGGYDLETGKYFPAQEIIQIGKLPTRQILLAQLVGMVQAPLRSLAYVLSQVADSKKS